MNKERRVQQNLFQKKQSFSLCPVIFAYLESQALYITLLSKALKRAIWHKTTKAAHTKRKV
jgi:hypothetical protein